jgi:class 3 adenylate cyclase
MRGGVVSDIQIRDDARRALEEHAWKDAYEGLVSLRDRQDLSGEDWQRLGEAAWWSAHPAESIEAFERAFATYSSEGNPRRAAAVAIRLAHEHADRMELALWNAWLQRAVRLLADQPECVEMGYLETGLVRASFDRGAMDEASEHASRAQEIGARFDDPDLVAFGRVMQGAAMVFSGEVERGLGLVDEGTLAAVGGELTPYAAGSIYCITITVCRSVADYRRAAEWTTAATGWCERQSITGFPGVCRVQRAEIMRLRGKFSEAEDEARQAQTELTAFGRLPQAGAGSNEIGEVRLRLGDLDGAEEAFRAAHQLGYEPHPGLALVHLARGRTDAARASIATALADAVDPIGRARLLAAKAEIALAAHDVTEARAAADELGGIASSLDSPVLHAMSHQTNGVTLTSEDDAPAAIVELRKALRTWTEADAPFEAAQTRRSLALAHRRSGDEASAILELQVAKESFAGLGARREADRCDELLRAVDDAVAGHRVIRTFLFTDIVGSTDLIGTIGDEAWNDVLSWHDDTLGTVIGSHGGTVVRTTGDGFFASFGDAGAALDCAIAIQRRLAEHRRRHGFAPQVRIGVHAAEATAVADDYAGLGVHEAARVGALAAGGEILATTSTVAAAATHVAAGDERKVSLKGLPHPVTVVSIGWRET